MPESTATVHVEHARPGQTRGLHCPALPSQPWPGPHRDSHGPTVTAIGLTVTAMGLTVSAIGITVSANVSHFVKNWQNCQNPHCFAKNISSFDSFANNGQCGQCCQCGQYCQNWARLSRRRPFARRFGTFCSEFLTDRDMLSKHHIVLGFQNSSGT